MLAAAATEVACVACVAALTRTVLFVPTKPVATVKVTTVSLVLTNDVPAPKATASVPANVKSAAAIVPVLNVPPVNVIVTVLFAAAVVNVGDVTVA